jgi:hypothetical protein
MVNSYFIRTGRCHLDCPDAPASEIKKGCHAAFALASALTGSIQVISNYYHLCLVQELIASPFSARRPVICPTHRLPRFLPPIVLATSPLHHISSRPCRIPPLWSDAGIQPDVAPGMAGRRSHGHLANIGHRPLPKSMRRRTRPAKRDDQGRQGDCWRNFGRLFVFRRSAASFRGFLSQ